MPPSGYMFTRRWVHAAVLAHSRRWWLLGPMGVAGRISVHSAACRAATSSVSDTQASIDTAGG